MHDACPQPKHLDIRTNINGSPVLPTKNNIFHALLEFLLTFSLICTSFFAHQQHHLVKTLQVDVAEARTFINDLNAVVPLKISCFTVDCTVDLLHDKLNDLNSQVDFLLNDNAILLQKTAALNDELGIKNAENSYWQAEFVATLKDKINSAGEVENEERLAQDKNNDNDIDTDKVANFYNELERSLQIIKTLTAELEESQANAMESSEMLYIYNELERTEKELSEAKEEARTASFERGASEELKRSQRIIKNLTAELDEASSEILYLFDELDRAEKELSEAQETMCTASFQRRTSEEAA
jgi:flagellin-specific chaperone FliS